MADSSNAEFDDLKHRRRTGCGLFIVLVIGVLVFAIGHAWAELSASGVLGPEAEAGTPPGATALRIAGGLIVFGGIVGLTLRAARAPDGVLGARHGMSPSRPFSGAKVSWSTVAGAGAGAVLATGPMGSPVGNVGLSAIVGAVIGGAAALALALVLRRSGRH